MMRLSSFCFLLGLVATPLCGLANGDEGRLGSGREAFAQLGQELPDPNVYRTASGAPGTDYWQQRADYRITAKLDAAARRKSASTSPPSPNFHRTCQAAARTDKRHGPARTDKRREWCWVLGLGPGADTHAQPGFRCSRHKLAFTRLPHASVAFSNASEIPNKGVMEKSVS